MDAALRRKLDRIERLLWTVVALLGILVLTRLGAERGPETVPLLIAAGLVVTAVIAVATDRYPSGDDGGRAGGPGGRESR